MLKKISIALISVVAIILIMASFQPAQMNVSREIIIKASPEVIFPHVNNSKLMNEWMPWKSQDPLINMTYSGPDAGVGSKASWTSEGKMGVGEATIVEVTQNSLVKTKLQYFKPMAMEQMASMELSSVEGGTKLRWGVTCENSFIGKIFGVFMNMDKMIGDEFSKGLNTLKTKIETAQ